MKLRPFQRKLKDNVVDEWKNCKNVLAVLPTGGGKTVIFTKVVSENQGSSCTIAHRQELVCQISISLNRERVPHRIIAPDNVVKDCVRLHKLDSGASYFDPNSQKAVAGVDTLIRAKNIGDWCKTVNLWVQDEAHHVLVGNKWGNAAAMFPNARGLGVTATPLRADGKGLGSHADGLFHTMVEGPTMRELINAGYLTDYRVFAPPSDLDLRDVPLTDGGDYSKSKMKKAVRKSHVIGDVVSHYKQFAMGEAGITFASDLESAHDIAEQFNKNGVPSVAISGKTSDSVRTKALRQLANGDILNVVNVDLLGEGVDVPAVKVVSFARPTQSLAVFKQQCGRVLRLLNPPDNWDEFTPIERLMQIKIGPKPHGKIIDHVGNIMRHGLPDSLIFHTLDARERRTGKKKDNILIRVCLECFSVYERYLSECPFCHTRPVPVERGSPEQVDGNLFELDAETLARMRGDINQIDMSVEDHRSQCIDKYMPRIGIAASIKRHEKNQEMQTGLRSMISLWAGKKREENYKDEEIYKLFYLTFGLDIMSAQALKYKEAFQLNEEIAKYVWTF